MEIPSEKLSHNPLNGVEAHCGKYQPGTKASYFTTVLRGTAHVVVDVCSKVKWFVSVMHLCCERLNSLLCRLSSVSIFDNTEALSSF